MIFPFWASIGCLMYCMHSPGDLGRISAYFIFYWQYFFAQISTLIDDSRNNMGLITPLLSQGLSGDSYLWSHRIRCRPGSHTTTHTFDRIFIWLLTRYYYHHSYSWLHHYIEGVNWVLLATPRESQGHLWMRECHATRVIEPYQTKT